MSQISTFIHDHATIFNDIASVLTTVVGALPINPLEKGAIVGVLQGVQSTANNMHLNAQQIEANIIAQIATQFGNAGLLTGSVSAATLAAAAPAPMTNPAAAAAAGQPPASAAQPAPNNSPAPAVVSAVQPAPVVQPAVAQPAPAPAALAPAPAAAGVVSLTGTTQTQGQQDAQAAYLAAKQAFEQAAATAAAAGVSLT